METIYINIDSKFRDQNKYSNSGKFSVYFGDKLKNIKYIKLYSIEIPNLYYSITNERKNNFFIITILSKNYTINLDNGFYNSTQLLTSIQNQFNNIDSINSNNNPTININLNTKEINISCSLYFSINFTNTSLYDSLGKILGFSQNEYNNINSLTSEFPFNIVIDNYLFVKINDYGNIYNNINSSNSSDINQSPYLAKVILTSTETKLSFAIDKLITKEHIFQNPINIFKLNIELIDNYGNNINMLKLNYSMTLECGCIINNTSCFLQDVKS